MTSSNDASAACRRIPRAGAVPGVRFARGTHHPDVRRQPRHRPGDRPACGARRRQHRADGQDRRTPPQTRRHGVHRRPGTDRGGRGTALPLVGDVAQRPDVARAVAAAVERFGGIDVVVNNASAIDLSTTDAVDMKRTTSCRTSTSAAPSCSPSSRCRRCANPLQAHILTLSPPLNLDPHWAGVHLRLHHGQVRHEPDHAGPGRGTRRRPASASTRCGRAR